MNLFLDIGLLIIRVGLGMMFIAHGAPKILAGPEMWEEVGKAVGIFGINFAPAFWGFMASLSEFAGGILLAVGFLFRPACAFMLITMIVAASMHISRGDGVFAGAAHAIEAGIVFLGLAFTGPGRFSLSGLLSGKLLRP